MRCHSRYFLACSGAVLALACFLAGLEVSTTTAAPSVSQGMAIVNRTLKGDRLPPATANSRNAVNGPADTRAPSAPTAEPRLLEGCEPVVSAIGQPPLARVPGRCLS
jgi:hypothetical protein